MDWKDLRIAAALTCSLGLAGCLGGTVTGGSGGTDISGSAAGSSSADAGNLERCEQTLGTLAMDDGRQSSWWGPFSQNTGVTTIEPLLRMVAQQSNCFVVTSVGNLRLDDRMTQITQKQRDSGEFRAGSKQEKGQRVAADYFLEPAIIINDASMGSVGGALGGLLPGVFGAVAGGMEQKASVVTMSLFDIRSQVQVAASEGSATATNYGAAAVTLTGAGGGALGGLSQTPEGKATIAAFLDAYNGMVVALRSYEAQDVEGGLGRGGTLKVN
ncbi:hypothetical protein [Geminicoccus roseus]|uniref:hypothetical protein n=1 Tax=Geminicoccus roseus TaxID=404900 RepID=UPI00042A10AF|nr:hypothetical protein [Geminicoccus roseus]